MYLSYKLKRDANDYLPHPIRTTIWNEKSLVAVVAPLPRDKTVRVVAAAVTFQPLVPLHHHQGQFLQ